MIELPASVPAIALAQAERTAAALLEALGPACLRLEVAGSVRRRRPTVGDVELVAIPRLRTVAAVGQSGLFNDPRTVAINELWERIEELSEGHDRIVPIKPGASRLVPDLKWPEKRIAGSRYFRLYLPRVPTKLDLWLADVDTWGAVFTIRTGSAEFSEALVTRWTAVSGGGHFQRGRVCRGEQVLQTPEERDVFEACCVEWVEPPERVDAAALRPLRRTA